ncbi:inositol monophosphatase family protein [Agarivorans sp. DSG3-1]|uniref:inositol monophosphatase family protein n=1 Tax=Agarivorans sp. DSG3-1 TaxID=3342249 RepID=UPI00398F534F
MSPNSLDRILASALPIAKHAGELAIDWFKRRDALLITSKGHQDWVSQADQEVESYLRQALLNAFPQHQFLGEENGGRYQPPCWVVDPIDGTTNFLYGQADFVVSLAFADEQGPALGIIVAPALQRLLYAVRGKGAFEIVDGKAKALKPRAAAKEQLVVGLNLNYQPGIPQQYMAHSQVLIDAGHQVRVNGSAAWGLTQVATGELDACYMGEVNIWDAMAAQIICQEANLSTAPHLIEQLHGPVWAWPKDAAISDLLSIDNHKEQAHQSVK